MQDRRIEQLGQGVFTISLDFELIWGALRGKAPMYYEPLPNWNTPLSSTGCCSFFRRIRDPRIGALLATYY
jgi:hypothetical protein